MFLHSSWPVFREFPFEAELLMIQKLVQLLQRYGRQKDFKILL